MRAHAASAGHYTSPWGKHPRLQLLTIEEILDGRTVDMPKVTGANVTFKKAPRKHATKDKQLGLLGEDPD